MARDTSKDPRCRHCGEKLRPFHYETIKLEKGEAYRGNMVEVSRKPGWNGEGEIVSLWDGGSFGRSGQNKFCSLRCGYQWAMRRAP